MDDGVKDLESTTGERKVVIQLSRPIEGGEGRSTDTNSLVDLRDHSRRAFGASFPA